MSHNYSKTFNKQEGLSRKADMLCDEYGIKAYPIATGTKWKAALGIFRMPQLNGPAMAVAACLINYADELTGIAWCSEHTIAKWTERTLRTVQRGVADLKRLGLIKITRRRGESNICQLQWVSFLVAFARPAKSGGTTPARSGGTPPPEVAAYSYYLSSLMNRVVQAAESTARTTLNEEERRGIQEEVNRFISENTPKGEPHEGQ